MKISLVLLASVALIAGCEREATIPTRASAVPARNSRPHPNPPQHPNILLITMDTLRYDQTGLPPEGTNPTPFLRELAQTAVEFTNSYSTHDSTPESHFSMLTGYVNGLYDNDVDKQQNAVPYQLARIGYDTFGVVANGNLSQRTSRDVRGFKRYECLYDNWDAMSRAQKNRASKEIDDRLRLYGAPVDDFNRSMLYVRAPLVVSEFAKELSQTKGPFFGFVNLLDAHDPYLPDPRWYDADAEEAGLRPKNFSSDLRTRPLPSYLKHPLTIRDRKRRAEVRAVLDVVETRRWQATLDLTPEAMKVYRQRYRAEIREVDGAVRQIFDILRQKGLLSSTIVIVTSDHGEILGEGNLITHSFSDRVEREVSHRVPLLMYFPPSYGIGAHRLSVATTSADIAPTIYDIVGIDYTPTSRVVIPGQFGKSLYPYVTSPQPYERENAPAVSQKVSFLPRPAASSQPNLLLVTLDAVRYDETSLAPGSTNETPFLRRLADAGIEFSNSYSTFDDPVGSHFSMLTGYLDGIFHSDIDNPENALPYRLNQLGYDTFGVAADPNLSQNKNPELQPFKRFDFLLEGWPKISAIEMDKRVDERLRRYDAPLNDFNRAMLYASSGTVLTHFEKAISTTRQPFFGLINLSDAHDPYLPDPQFYDPDTAEKNRPKRFWSDLRTRPIPDYLKHPDAIANPQRRDAVKSAVDIAQYRLWQATFDLKKNALNVYRQRYCAEVRDVDRAVKQIFDVLRERNLLSSTIVIVTSSNGELLGEGNLITHSFLNRTQREVAHRVPLIVYLPPSYRIVTHRVTVPTSSADLAPTIYDLLGIDSTAISRAVLPGHFGKSLYPYLMASTPTISYSTSWAEGRPQPESETRKIQEEARRRLKALGYIQ